MNAFIIAIGLVALSMQAWATEATSNEEDELHPFIVDNSTYQTIWVDCVDRITLNAEVDSGEVHCPDNEVVIKRVLTSPGGTFEHDCSNVHRITLSQDMVLGPMSLDESCE